MDLRELGESVLSGDLLRARQWVSPSPPRYWSCLQAVPGGSPPAWTSAVGALDEVVIVDPGLERMRRSFAFAKEHSPASLLKRTLVALPDFLAVA